MSADDTLDDVIPPIGGDRSRLYLGARAAGFDGATFVTYWDLGPEPGDGGGVLPVPDLGTPAPTLHPFAWGGRSLGHLLACTLLRDACGDVACRRLWREFAADVVCRLPRDEWELSAGRIQAWVTRRLAAPPAADLSEGGGA